LRRACNADCSEWDGAASNNAIAHGIEPILTCDRAALAEFQRQASGSKALRKPVSMHQPGRVAK
jgi:hypothetical protein